MFKLVQLQRYATRGCLAFPDKLSKRDQTHRDQHEDDGFSGKLSHRDFVSRFIDDGNVQRRTQAIERGLYISILFKVLINAVIVEVESCKGGPGTCPVSRANRDLTEKSPLVREIHGQTGAGNPGSG